MEKDNKKKTVSFSQFQNWWGCPQRWMLDYIKKLKTFEDTLNMSFGTAIHQTIQFYLRALFLKSTQHANKMNKLKYFIWAFKHELKKKKIQYTPEEFNEFCEDGEKILQDFSDLENIMENFSPYKYTFIDIEHEVNMDIKNNVHIVSKLDLVLQEKLTKRIKIFDIKTATNAWTAYQKEDFSKTSQLVLYKALYSKKYNIPLSMIDVEFYIVRRKLYPNSRFQQSHIQKFSPISDQRTTNEVIVEFNKFLDECFTKEGTHNINNKYPKIPGKNKKNCKYCPHKKSGICDTVPDVI